MEQLVYQVRDVDELKQRLIDVWHGFKQSVIDDAVDNSNNNNTKICIAHNISRRRRQSLGDEWCKCLCVLV